MFIVDIQCPLYGVLMIKKSKHSLYIGQDCTKDFCSCLEKMLQMSLIQTEEICATIFFKKFPKNKNYPKVRDYCHFTGKCKAAPQSIRYFRFNETNEIPRGFHNELDFDYYFIIKELADESERQFECFERNTEKCRTIHLSQETTLQNVIKMVTKVSTYYQIKLIDSARMVSSLSNHVDNLTE